MKYLAVLFCGVLGCSSFPENLVKFPESDNNYALRKYVHLDPQFGGIELEIIKNAFKEWTTATKGLVQWNYEDWPDYDYDYDSNSGLRVEGETESNCHKHLLVMRTISSDPQIISRETKIGYGINGYHTATPDKCGTEIINLVIDKMENPNVLRIASLHEIGHSVGLKHAHDKLSIMSYKLMYQANGITAYDVNTFCRLWKC